MTIDEAVEWISGEIDLFYDWVEYEVDNQILTVTKHNKFSENEVRKFRLVEVTE